MNNYNSNFNNRNNNTMCKIDIITREKKNKKVNHYR